MANPEEVSAVLIALNEERRIGDALASVAWADEILVVDGGSTDRTTEMCRRAGARLVERPFQSYVEQKNFGLQQASHDWILSLDADERVSTALAREIRSVAADGFRASGYRIPRISYYMGRYIRSTAWYPDHQLRLFDRRRGRWQGRYVHESVRVDGPVGKLRGEILHHSYESVSDHLTRLDRYAGLAAREMWEAGRRGGLTKAIVYPPFVFLKNYAVKRGFVDGAAGWTISVLNAFYVLVKYLKLWELERAHSRREAPTGPRP